MGKIVLCGVLSGLIFLVWGSVSWMALPFHEDSMHGMPMSEAEMAPMLEKLKASGDGVYHFPGTPPTDEKEMEAWTKRYEEGPVLTQVIFKAQGGSAMPPMNFIMGFLSNALAGMILAWMLTLTSLEAYGRRVLFIAAGGVFAVLATQVEEAMWWKKPCEYVLPTMADVLVGWTLCGLVIAKLAPRS